VIADARRNPSSDARFAVRRRAARGPAEDTPAMGLPDLSGRNGTLVTEFLDEGAPRTRGIAGRHGAAPPPSRTTDTYDATHPRERTAAMDLVVFLPLLIIMGAFMYFASRRQKKAMQATIDLHNSLQVGDRVHTTSGLQGTITALSDDSVDLEIAPGVVTTWMKLAVRDRIVDDVEDLDEDDDLDALTSQGDLEARSTATELTDRPNSKTDS
jgi:preprotein translocase subunit YajC